MLHWFFINGRKKSIIRFPNPKGNRKRKTNYLLSPVATRSLFSKPATEEIQNGCSRPCMPWKPWARFTTVSGFFLERPQRATDLGNKITIIIYHVGITWFYFYWVSFNVYSPIICTRHHMLFIDELDAVNRTPNGKKEAILAANKSAMQILQAPSNQSTLYASEHIFYNERHSTF